MHIMRNKNSGFTLVELLVSFALLLILTSISVVGVFAYQDFADFKRQNEYSQTLFIAAQNRLTAYDARGESDKMMGIPGTLLRLNMIVTPSGKSASETDNGMSAKKGPVYYLTGNKEAYEKYLAGEYRDRTDEASLCYQTLYDIFDGYLADKSILRAAISLEYNPEEGIVYSVLYSDKNNRFVYTGTNGDGMVNICDRREGYRSEYMIGYYGLE